MPDQKAPQTAADLAAAKKNKYWRRTVSFFGIMAEVANVGILVEIIAKWVPRFALLASSAFLVYLMAIADPLIYFFRALIRLTRILGRKFFGVTFEEEKHGIHKYQTHGDLLSLALFGLAILFFSGLILASPVSLTLAWTCGLCGLVPIGFFDYVWPERKAKEHYDNLLKDKDAAPESREQALKEYTALRTSKRLFIALLIGLSLLLICGSAAAFAPPLLVPVLAITSKIASIYLGAIAVGRFFTWLFKGKEAEPQKKAAPADQASKTASPPPTPTHKKGPQAEPAARAQASASAAQPAPDAKFGANSSAKPSPSQAGLFGRAAAATPPSVPSGAPQAPAASSTSAPAPAPA